MINRNVIEEEVPEESENEEEVQCVEGVGQGRRFIYHNKENASADMNVETLLAN